MTDNTTDDECCLHLGSGCVRAGELREAVRRSDIYASELRSLLAQALNGWQENDHTTGITRIRQDDERLRIRQAAGL